VFQAVTVLAKQLVNLRKQKTKTYAVGSRVQAIGTQGKVKFIYSYFMCMLVSAERFNISITIIVCLLFVICCHYGLRILLYCLHRCLIHFSLCYLLLLSLLRNHWLKISLLVLQLCTAKLFSSIFFLLVSVCVLPLIHSADHHFGYC